MRTTDLFKNNRSSKKINESIAKTFGRKLNLEAFDLAKLEDARNKLRTQIHTVRGSSSFNENLENDAYHEAQWMLDAINSEIAERQEFVSNPQPAEVEEGYSSEVDEFFAKVAVSENDGYDMLYDAQMGKYGDEIEQAVQSMYDDVTIDHPLHPDDDFEKIYDIMLDQIEKDYADSDRDSDEGGETDDAYALASAGHGSDEDYESINNEDEVDDFVAAGGKIQQGRPQRGPRRPGLSMASRHIGGGGDKMKASRTGKAANTRGKPVVGKNESVTTGDDMTKLQEGEIQQASAIVTAKTMVDRVGRWIEELSGMENDTLLQLGDSIRDEMGQEQAKTFISSVAPAIQQALENLKATREALSSGVRTLTGEEQAAGMLGAEPAPEAGGLDDLAGPAEPDAMNEPTGDIGDEFGAAEPAAGGMNDAGREKRESIERANNLLKVLAG